VSMAQLRLLRSRVERLYNEWRAATSCYSGPTLTGSMPSLLTTCLSAILFPGCLFADLPVCPRTGRVQCVEQSVCWCGRSCTASRGPCSPDEKRQQANGPSRSTRAQRAAKNTVRCCQCVCGASHAPAVGHLGRFATGCAGGDAPGVFLFTLAAFPP